MTLNSCNTWSTKQQTHFFSSSRRSTVHMILTRLLTTVERTIHRSRFAVYQSWTKKLGTIFERHVPQILGSRPVKNNQINGKYPSALSNEGIPTQLRAEYFFRSSYQSNYNSLHAALSWQVLWRCWFYFPAGHGISPTLPKVPKLIQWLWCSFA